MDRRRAAAHAAASAAVAPVRFKIRRCPSRFSNRSLGSAAGILSHSRRALLSAPRPERPSGFRQLRRRRALSLPGKGHLVRQSLFFRARGSSLFFARPELRALRHSRTRRRLPSAHDARDLFRRVRQPLRPSHALARKISVMVRRRFRRNPSPRSVPADGIFLLRRPCGGSLGLDRAVSSRVQRRRGTAATAPITLPPGPLPACLSIIETRFWRVLT